MKITRNIPSEYIGRKPTNKRYYCRQYEGTGKDHCDDFKHTIQCKECIVKQEEYNERVRPY